MLPIDAQRTYKLEIYK